MAPLVLISVPGPDLPGMLLIGTCGSQVGVVAGTLPKFLGHLEIRLADPPLLDFDVVRRSARVRVITNTLQGDRVPLTSKFQIRQRVRISSVPYLVQLN